MNLIKRLTEHIDKTNFNSLPSEVVERTKVFILDTIGVGIAGCNAPGVKEIINLISRWNKTPISTIMVYGTKTSPPEAALANSVMMHALDFDDTLDGGALHTFVSVLPAALAVAEDKKDVDGKAFITAITLGVDMICRLGSAIKTPLSWIRTATLGSFGATATSAKLYGLKGEKLLNSFGIVYSQTAGNAQCLIDGGLTKRMQPGFSAKAAVFSCALANLGVTGSKNVFEGEYGFFNLYEKGKYAPERVTKDLGNHFGIMDLSLKPYPSCRMTHAAIEAAINIRNKFHIDISSIEKILVYTSKMVADMVGAPFEIRDNPQVDAQFSIPYTLAVALSKGKVFLEDFLEENIKNEEIINLAKKVKVIVEPSRKENDISWANVIIKDKYGRIFTLGVDGLKGSPQKPLTREESIDKFKQALSFSKKPSFLKKSDKLIEKILDLDRQNSISDIFHLITE